MPPLIVVLAAAVVLVAMAGCQPDSPAGLARPDSPAGTPGPGAAPTTPGAGATPAPGTPAAGTPAAEADAPAVWGEFVACARAHDQNWPDPAFEDDQAPPTFPEVEGFDLKDAYANVQADCGSILDRLPLRRALGARRLHIAAQFLTESVLLGAIGGAAGLALGAGVTRALASVRDWIPVVPPLALWGGLTMAVAVGTVAGLHPAARAARLTPTDALRTS